MLANVLNVAKFPSYEATDLSDSVVAVTTQIFVTFRKEGIHAYPAAPAQVSFLRTPHRHIFHFRVDIDVFHDDRELEFIMFKRELEELYDHQTLQLNNKSCEMMIDDLASYISVAYPNRSFTIEISEDGENGARKTFTPLNRRN